MAAQLEEILSRLLVPDNAVIQQATLELKVATKDPAAIPALCTILGSSQNPQLRQYAAILLRRRIMRARQWKALPQEVIQGIRENILQLILQEPEKTVRKAIAQIVGTVAKHELPHGRWPAFFTFVEQHVKSSEAQQRELGLYVLSVASSVATQQLQPHLQAIMTLCAAALDDHTGHMVPYLAIRTLTYMVIAVGTDEEKAFQQLIPKILPVIKNLIAVDEELAIESLEILDELVECEVAVIVPHIRTVIEFCMEIGSTKTLSDSLRIKALSFLSWLTRLKKKSVMKLKLTSPILGALFPIMCEPNEDEDDDQEFEEAEASTAPSFAAQVVDTMALHLPPERLMPPLLKLVEAAVQNEDPYTRKAGLIALAVVAEGCSDYIRHKHLQALLELVCKCVDDPSQIVRNAALFALGQFSEYFQPDISKFSGQLFPLLFTQMNQASQNIDKDPKGVTKIYYALEMCCENLGKDILPYLPTLMQHLLAALSTAVTPHAKELAISAIGATANAAKKEIVPYFGQIIEQLKTFLAPAQDEDQQKVQMQALDTLGVLARTMGEHFQPLAMECLGLGLSLLREATDPDLKRCIYGLLAAISTLLKEQMQPCLEEIVKEMIASVKSEEGITTHSDDETTDMFKIFDDDVEEKDQEIANGMEEEEEEDETVSGFSINNAYLGEKEDACVSLGELSITTGVAFTPFMPECMKEVMLIVEHPSPDVRKASLAAVSQFCCATNQIYKDLGTGEAGQVLQGMLTLTVPLMVRLVKEDLDRHVAMVALESLNEMLEKIGAPILQIVSCQNLISCVKDVLQLKIASQDPDESDEGGDDQQAEYDAMLVENAGDIIPAVAKIVGGEAFRPYMAGLLPELLKKTKSSSTTPDKSFSVGTLADCVDAMGTAAASFAPLLFPIFMGLAKDEDEEVRSNAVFGLGMLAAKTGPAMLPNFPHILKLYFELLNPEQNRRVVDNICAGFCRLIWANIEAVPVDQVIPIIVQCLPLKEDLEENVTVYPCIAELYKNNHAVLLQQLPQLLTVYSQVLGSEDLKDETQNLLVHMTQNIAQNHADVFQNVIKSLPDIQSSRLQACLSMTNGS